MTDQQNPFSTMPEPPAAPDPAQAFDNAQGQGQAAQSYDTDPTAQQAYDPYQAQQPYGAGQGFRPSKPTSSPIRLPTSSRSRLISKCTPSPWLRRRLRPSIP